MRWSDPVPPYPPPLFAAWCVAWLKQVEAVSCTFAHMKDSGVCLELTEEGRRVTRTRGSNDWASVAPGARGGVHCWHVKLHTNGTNVTIGVIGVSDPPCILRPMHFSDRNWVPGAEVQEPNTFCHPTSHGWSGFGNGPRWDDSRLRKNGTEWGDEGGDGFVYVAGQCKAGHGGWPD